MFKVEHFFKCETTVSKKKNKKNIFLMKKKTQKEDICESNHKLEKT